MSDGAGLGRRLPRHLLGEAHAELVRERLGDLQAGHRRGERLLPRLRAHAGHAGATSSSPASGRSSASRRCGSACPTIVGAIRLPAAPRLAARDGAAAHRRPHRRRRAPRRSGSPGGSSPHDDLMAEARRLADRLVAGGPARGTGHQGGGHARPQQLPPLEAIRFGETMRRVAAATDDAAEGMPRRSRGSSPAMAGSMSETAQRRSSTR